MLQAEDKGAALGGGLRRVIQDSIAAAAEAEGGSREGRGTAGEIDLVGEQRGDGGVRHRWEGKNF